MRAWGGASEELDGSQPETVEVLAAVLVVAGVGVGKGVVTDAAGPTGAHGVVAGQGVIDTDAPAFERAAAQGTRGVVAVVVAHAHLAVVVDIHF